MSNAGSCLICNIQNSNNSITSKSNNTKSNSTITIKQRYNPAALTNADTSNIVNQVVNVNAQVGQSVADTGGGTGKIKNVNTLTLQAVSQIVNVQSEIVASDVQNLKKGQNRQTVQLLAAVDKKDTTKINKGRKVFTKIANKQYALKVGGEKKRPHYNPKRFGTVLASSPIFQAKFTALSQNNTKPIKTIESSDTPESFDGRNVWENFIHPVRNQGLCGSCWAFSSLFVFAARLSIMTGGKYKYMFSTGKMVYCAVTLAEDPLQEIEDIKKKLYNSVPYDYKLPTDTSGDTFGCDGESLINAWQFLYRFGVPENNCLLYGDEPQGDPKFNLTLHDKISFTCADFTTNDFDFCPSNNTRMISHRAGGYYYVPGAPKNEGSILPGGTEMNIRREIYQFGPVTSGMVIHDDFLHWNPTSPNEIYQYDGTSASNGGHAISIIGWGVSDTGIKYWIIRNSWGSEWGDKGYFKILRGSNHCEIEENVFVGVPDIPGIRKFINYPIYFEMQDYISRYLWGINNSGIKILTYEKLALGLLKDEDVSSQFIYSLDSFPNFHKFIAGQVIYNPNTESFNYDDDEDGEENKMFKVNQKINYKLILIFILILLTIFM